MLCLQNMEDSSSSSSYSFSDISMDTENSTLCMCTKITYNQSHPISPVVTPDTSPEHRKCHRILDRSHSDPAIRLSDREDQEESPGLEPNCDLFGIQLEVTFHLLEAEKRKLYVLQRELGHLNANLTNIKKHVQKETLQGELCLMYKNGAPHKKVCFK
ncbi:uncharacterized protein LOC128546125 [Mercenaria mercenaria]|uniref:uncharacterized protein LOC128546125 n=1 Tax=Mercenaria mercenaria TaxID=6596 RepID=UPI00234ED555|nr:uncharacterized protein LOC128546125 [Mercenaria mercenaria]